MRRLVAFFAIAAAVLLQPGVAAACSVCFGDGSSKLGQGANNGVLFMIGIIVLVQIGFLALFWSFWRRARALRRHREQFRLIEGGAR